MRRLYEGMLNVILLCTVYGVHIFSTTYWSFRIGPVYSTDFGRGIVRPFGRNLGTCTVAVCPAICQTNRQDDRKHLRAARNRTKDTFVVL
jgi:hypothetical protein